MTVGQEANEPFGDSRAAMETTMDQQPVDANASASVVVPDGERTVVTVPDEEGEGAVVVVPDEEGEDQNNEEEEAKVDEEKPRFSQRMILNIIGWTLVFFGLFILPFAPKNWLEDKQQRLLGILIAVVASWFLTLVAIPVTAMMIGPLVVMYGVTTTKEGFHYYADPVLFLFYGALFIGKSMSRHGLDRRIAYTMTESKWVSGIAWRVRVACMGTGMLMSMWLSNTGSTAILVPIVMGTLPSVKHLSAKEKKSVTGTLLGVTYCCSAGGMSTTVGTPPNIVAVRLLEAEGLEFSFVEWMMMGVPVTLVMVCVIFALFSVMYPAGDVIAKVDPSETEGLGRGPMKWGEKVTLVAFIFAVLGWLLPSLFDAADVSFETEAKATFPTSVVAMLAAFILFLVPDKQAEKKKTPPPTLATSETTETEEESDFLEEEEDTRVLPFEEALKIDWGVIMIVGGGIVLGNAMKNSGLANTIGQAIVDWTGVDNMWSVTAVFTIFTIFFTELCSNTAATNVILPLVISISNELGVSPIPASFGVTLGASCAFMMPIATPSNAIVFGTKLIPLMTMVKTGLILNIISFGVIMALVRGLTVAYGWNDLSDNVVTA